MADSLETAETAIAAHLDGVLSGVKVYAGASDVARQRRMVFVHASTATWSVHRDVVDMELECWAQMQTPAQGEALLTELVDSVAAAVQTFDTDEVFWGGVGTELISDLSDEIQRIDPLSYATGVVQCTVAVEHVADRTIGPAEKRVNDLLAAAGIEVVTSADKGDYVQTRWTGSPPDDPRFDEVHIWVSTPVESGRSEALSRKVWDVLYHGGYTVVTNPLAADMEGSSPGSVFSHEVMEMHARLTQTPAELRAA